MPQRVPFHTGSGFGDGLLGLQVNRREFVEDEGNGTRVRLVQLQAGGELGLNVSDDFALGFREADAYRDILHWESSLLETISLTAMSCQSM